MPASGGRMLGAGALLVALLCLATPCSAASFIGVPWMAKAREGGRLKIEDSLGFGLGEVREHLQRGLGAITCAVREKFETHRLKAEKRWLMRQKALAKVTAAQDAQVQHALRSDAERVADAQREAAASGEGAVGSPEVQDSDYEGYTAQQVEFMKTHYATIRPSPTLLRKPPSATSPPAPQPEYVRSETDDLGEHVLAPTHEDELEIAKRRESFHISRRLRHHRIEKSHTH